MPSPTTARPGLSFILGILAFCLVGVLVLFVRSSLTTTRSYEEKRAEARLKRITQLRREDRRKLSTYAWSDKAKGVVQIPVGRAIELTLAELKAQNPAASTVKAEANTTNIVPPSLLPAAAASTTGTAPVSAPATTGTAKAPTPATSPAAPAATVK